MSLRLCAHCSVLAKMTRRQRLEWYLWTFESIVEEKLSAAWTWLERRLRDRRSRAR